MTYPPLPMILFMLTRSLARWALFPAVRGENCGPAQARMIFWGLVKLYALSCMGYGVWRYSIARDSGEWRHFRDSIPCHEGTRQLVRHNCKVKFGYFVRKWRDIDKTNLT